LYSYKVYGELKGIEPEVCAKVYMDLDYRKIWDGYVKGTIYSRISRKIYDRILT